MPRLYVIGNGFDKHHRMPSGYDAFGRFVAHVDPDLFQTASEFLFWDDDLWADFEANLAHIDEDAILDDAGNYLASYGDDDWSDDSHHSYQRRIDEIVSALSSDLRRHFVDWIRTLAPPAPGSGYSPANIDPAALFLTFNYTPTLQRLYGVPERNVLHIHGRSSDAAADIILGHGWKRPAPRPMLNEEGEEIDERDTRIIEGENRIRQYFADTFKPTEQILQRHAVAFQGLGAINEVWVMGHSFAEVDLPYFAAIRDHVAPLATWRASFYKPEEHDQFAEALAGLGLVAPQVELMRIEAF